MDTKRNQSSNTIFFFIYWYEKYQYILKRKCQVGINVVFLDVILKLYDVCFMKNIFIAPWTCLHHSQSDLHIIIRWPENVRRVNKICLHCGHFIHCFFVVEFCIIILLWTSHKGTIPRQHYRRTFPEGEVHNKFST